MIDRHTLGYWLTEMNVPNVWWKSSRIIGFAGKFAIDQPDLFFDGFLARGHTHTYKAQANNIVAKSKKTLAGGRRNRSAIATIN